MKNIPTDREKGTLNDLCVLKKDSCRPSDSKSNVYIGLEHIESGRFSVRFYGKPEQVISAKNCFAPNDILYGKLRPYLDKAAVAITEGICSTDILVFTPKDKTPPFFIAGLLHTDRFIQYAIQTTHGLNHPRTSWVSLKAFPTLIPSLPEQQKIAAVLYKIQRAIEVQESIIEKTRELKKSTLHHVFTHGLRGEKLKETEIGPIPGRWDLIKIGECCDVRSSTISFNELNQGRSENNDVLCHAIKVSDMNLPGNEKYIFSANIETKLSSKVVSEKTIPANSVIFPKRGAAIATNKKRLTTLCSLLDPNLIAIIPRACITSEFLYYWFLTFDLASIQDLGPTPQLNKKDVEPISIPCPSNREQLEISYIFRVIDQKIDLHTAKKSVLQDLFKTILNKLMTGEIRVKDLDIDVSEVNT
jgi:type I restriction enzyme S subunit